MNSNRFNTRSDTFHVLDLKGKFRFKTSSSICFDLGSPEYGTIFGNMQVHHPCDGHIKTFVYVHLPERYQDSNLLVEILKTAFRELEIPEDETYTLEYYDATCLCFSQYVNREGVRDRI